MKLTQAELDIMQELWGCEEPIRPSALLQKMQATRPWSISTLKTLLSRLEEKGAVRSTSVKRFMYYSPTVTKEQYFRLETQKLITQLNTSSPVSLVAGLINSDTISESELEQIEELLRQARDRISNK